ncbi:MAG TPA: PAS domain S-box protein, partial [Thermoleophilaceae bacterium]|nr:PAS domain S-box protein [Thermoleophilaceae bacterium]
MRRGSGRFPSRPERVIETGADADTSHLSANPPGISSHSSTVPLREAAADPRGGTGHAQLELLADLSPGLLVCADATGRISLASGGWQRVLGWTPAQVIGRGWEELVHPADRGAARSAAAAKGEGSGEELSFECRLATREGGWRWISWRLRAEGGSWYGAGQDTHERRGKEQELRRSEARFEEAQEVAGLGSFELDFDSHELWWSRETYRIHGLDPDGPPVALKSAVALSHPEDLPRLVALFEHATTAAPSTGTTEYRIERPDGEERVLLVRWTIVEGPAGMRRLLGTMQDVSEHRRAEQALAAGQRKLRALVEQVPAIVYTASLGADVQWDYVSPQIETMLGYTAEEWKAGRRLWFEAIHPDDRERVLSDEDEVSSPQDQLRSEYRLRRRDGTWIWVRDEAQVIEDERGELRFQGVLLDITEAKQIEAALAGSEERYRTLVETSQDMIWACDLESRFTFVNDAVRSIHGYDPSEMIGRPYSDFNHPDVADIDAQVTAELLAGQSYFQFETKHLRRDGSTVELSFNATVLR